MRNMNSRMWNPLSGMSNQGYGIQYPECGSVKYPECQMRVLESRIWDTKGRIWNIGSEDGIWDVEFEMRDVDTGKFRTSWMIMVDKGLRVMLGYLLIEIMLYIINS